MSTQSGEIRLREQAKGAVARLRELLEEQSNKTVKEIQALELTAKKIEALMQEVKSLSLGNQELADQLLPKHSKEAVLQEMSKIDLQIASLNDSFSHIHQQIQIGEKKLQQFKQSFEEKIQQEEQSFEEKIQRIESLKKMFL
ncbi:MAG: hypothetical protein K940chlam5_01640 [Candidatus Anoxychlamydiales bacterium]|nr:hypothetical protein [Candidatus Anoxychlamydiales bacterium]